ncbi:hypothetical protein HHK36_021256 [Tetracentron sinense]|uniref:J domain-containing protein n=1 Tax=Tetracentron sinense TaxID=13715 RepID=A0A834YTI9_TETSI|nr:hypothetical protein HHK36_021256 [Tetracentron sinense]
MATTVGMINGGSLWIQSGFFNEKKKMMKKMKKRVCSYSSSSSSIEASLTDQYRTLKIQPGASESEVKKAFRQLALKVVMSNLRDESTISELSEAAVATAYDSMGEDEQMRGMNDPDWDLWEEWMGWEGAGIRDYSSHINPYI